MREIIYIYNIDSRRSTCSNWIGKKICNAKDPALQWSSFPAYFQSHGSFVSLDTNTVGKYLEMCLKYTNMSINKRGRILNVYYFGTVNRPTDIFFTCLQTVFQLN